MNRETGLMAEPTAGSLGSEGLINKCVTAINMVWQVISTVTHVPQGHMLETVAVRLRTA